MNKMKKISKLKLLVFFCIFLNFIPIVQGDAVDPSDVPAILMVDVQGAKYVSEGAYFYFDIRNRINRTVEVNFTVPKQFIYEENVTSFLLEPNERVQLHLHAPQIKGNETCKIFYFYFTVEGYPLYYKVVVIDLSVLYGLLDGDKFGRTFDDLLEENYKLRQELNKLRTENERLKMENELLKLNNFQSSAFYQFLLIAIFAIAAFLVAFNIKELKRRRVA